MMGNVWEWMESPYSENYGTGYFRSLRGGSYYFGDNALASSGRFSSSPDDEYYYLGGIGFRVASEVPEPVSLSWLAIGGLAMFKPGRCRLSLLF